MRGRRRASSDQSAGGVPLGVCATRGKVAAGTPLYASYSTVQFRPLVLHNATDALSAEQEQD